MKCPPKSGERVDHRITITLQSWRLIFYTATLSIYLDFFPLLETKRVNSLVEQPSHRTLRKEPRLSDYFCGMIPTKKTRGVERARERDVREAYVFSLRCFYYYYVDIGSRKTVSRAQIQKLVIHTHSEGT